MRAGEEGKLVLTVYNDTTTFDAASPVDVGDSFLTILFVDAFPEEDFGVLSEKEVRRRIAKDQFVTCAELTLAGGRRSSNWQEGGKAA